MLSAALSLALTRVRHEFDRRIFDDLGSIGCLVLNQSRGESVQTMPLVIILKLKAEYIVWNVYLIYKI
ncbi:hypothetical protein SGGMMB4_01803 [Sodalis glossinidius str. 'morsitans']|uniref:Uncharacterized protein n=2 Tax=Sodalis glossinidius TaxID=63612 RepID=A0A193QHE1_SODGM|nr:hypothetical protein SGGMMB4_01803 [Sodalis glossinidius str. 'morsitans']